MSIAKMTMEWHWADRYKNERRFGEADASCFSALENIAHSSLNAGNVYDSSSWEKCKHNLNSQKRTAS